MSSYSQVAIISKNQFLDQYKTELIKIQKQIIKKVLKYHNELNDLADWAILSLKVNFHMNDSSHEWFSPLPLYRCAGMMTRYFFEKVNSIFGHFLLERLGSSEKSYVDDSHKTDALNLQVRKSIDYYDDTLYHAMLSIFFSPPGEKDEIGYACPIIEPNNCVNIIISMAKALILAIDSTSLYIKIFAKLKQRRVFKIQFLYDADLFYW